MAMIKRNKKYLDEFKAWLDAKGLSEKTIDNHISNADFFINDYLTYEDHTKMENGIHFLDLFFSDFFIRKCMWSTPASIRSTAASLKKFYRCMMELGYISQPDYTFVCKEIKENLPVWQRECEIYNSDADWEEDWENDDDFFPPDKSEPPMLMPTDEMYDLAFAFKDAKPWKMLSEDEIFAVQLSGGRIGYCSVMGQVGKHIALALYPGASAFDTFYRLFEMDPLEPFTMRTQDLLQMDCIKLSLENKGDLEEDDAEAVRAYAKKKGIVLRGSHAYPNFSRYYPHCIPWYIASEQEQCDLVAALEAVLALTRFLQNHEKDDICLRPFYDLSEGIPLFFRNEVNNFCIRLTSLPAPIVNRYPEPTIINDISLARLKKLKQKGILECEIVRAPVPVRENPEEAPYFPAMLVPVDHKTGKVYRVAAVNGRDYDPDDLLESTMDTLLQAGVYPKEIRIRTEETEALLQNFCKRAEIRLTVTDELRALDLAVDSLNEYLESDSKRIDPDEVEEAFAELVEGLSGMSDSELLSMPEDMEAGVRMLLETGILPEALANRLRNLFRI